MTRVIRRAALLTGVVSLVLALVLPSCPCEQSEQQAGGERERADRKRREDEHNGFQLVAAVDAGRIRSQRSSSLGRGGQE